MEFIVHLGKHICIMCSHKWIPNCHCEHKVVPKCMTSLRTHERGSDLSHDVQENQQTFVQRSKRELTRLTGKSWIFQAEWIKTWNMHLQGSQDGLKRLQCRAWKEMDLESKIRCRREAEEGLSYIQQEVIVIL